MTPIRILSLLICIVFGVASCSTEPRTEAPLRQAATSSSTSNGNGCWFLPPLISTSIPIGDFDSTLSPIVEIQELDAITLVPTGNVIARITKTSGPDQIQVLLGQYLLSWNKWKYPLKVHGRYRVSVILCARVLSFFNVYVAADIVELLSVDTRTFVGTLLNGTLAIPFFLNRCASSACTSSSACLNTATCDPWTGVSSPAANGTACDDGNACTQGDSCKNGSCAGAPVVCEATDSCHTAGTCDPSTGRCSNPAAPAGTACDDGNACTRSDSCWDGACVGSNPVTCTAADQCHSAGTCDPSTGHCSNPQAPAGTACDDGNACTRSDSCWDGACVGSNPVTCTAADSCHQAGACDPSTGHCSNPVAPNGTSCNDGNACTRSDSCQNGTCVGSAPVVCTSGDPCQPGGTCDPATGTCSTAVAANGTPCNDGNLCTRNDACQAGRCVGSNPVQCSGGNGPCKLAGSCDPSTGACSGGNAPDGTACTVGTECSENGCTNGVCSAGQCALPPTCRDLKATYPNAPDGGYLIDPDGAAGPIVPFHVYCDMTTAGGGWTLITSITQTANIWGVDSSIYIEPGTVNMTNRNMRLPGVTQILTVVDGQDEGTYMPPPPYDGLPLDLATAFDKAEIYKTSVGVVSDDPRFTPSLAWQDILDALNLNTGAVWFNQSYQQGVADNWEFKIVRVNTTGCLQTPLRGTYGQGNHGGVNSAGGPSGVSSLGAIWHHWGGELWAAGVNNTSSLRCNQISRDFRRWWKGVYLR